MILRVLHQLASAEGLLADPDFQPAAVSWGVRVAPSGHVLAIADLRRPAQRLAGRRIASESRAKDDEGEARAPLVAVQLRVPVHRHRSGNGANPHFCVDNRKYVFGCGDRPDARKPEAFRRLLSHCVEETGDAGVHAVALALERWASGEHRIALPAEARTNDLFAFVFEPDGYAFLHERPAVVAWWRLYRQRSRASAFGNGPLRECMVTGARVQSPAGGPIVKRVPGSLASGAYLVSCNARAFESYGLRYGENAPLSPEASESIGVALRRLVDDSFPSATDPSHPRSRRHVALGGETLCCLWSPDSERDGDVDAIRDALEGEPEALLAAAPPPGRRLVLTPRAAPCYALALSGAQGRLIVRDWVETTVPAAGAHLAAFVEALRVVRNAPPPAGTAPAHHLPVRTLIASIAADGEDGVPSPALATAVVRSALTGVPLPLAVLVSAVQRTCVEASHAWRPLERADARAALLKAWLILGGHAPATDALHEGDPSPAYHAGLVQAALERLEELATTRGQGGMAVNQLRSAVATPDVVQRRLLTRLKPAIDEASRDQRTRVRAIAARRTLDDALSRLAASDLPPRLDCVDRARFLLGRHHQRHAFFPPS